MVLIYEIPRYNGLTTKLFIQVLLNSSVAFRLLNFVKARRRKIQRLLILLKPGSHVHSRSDSYPEFLLLTQIVYYLLRFN